MRCDHSVLIPFDALTVQVMMPETGQSFALIYSIEDPLGNTPQAGVGLQVMGPDDGYICQFDKRVNTFWASRNNLELGATFKAAPGAGDRPVQAMLSEVSGPAGLLAPAQSAPAHLPRFMRREAGLG